ncbi:wall-associated receptor kinase 1-like [Lolium perenne]|uniref:wall-associated receptor kinase 1-like n=1 Tax=Lolium perenne TaxID=4522 RepID=UPI0021EB3990|nr:wall-associated receptor kinase 1-like [Lolium perenne]
MSRMPTTVQLLIVLHLLSVAAAQRQPSLALPGCREMCGNVTVPYPFGIGAGCHRDNTQYSDFELACDDSGPSAPRLTMASRGYRLAEISLAAGEATTYLNATRNCYNSTGGFDDRNRNTYMGIADSPFLFSSNKTQLVALGCPTLGFFVDGEGQYVSGCMSVCRKAQLEVGSCRSAIPTGIDFFEPVQNNLLPRRSQREYATIASLTTPCHYVFLVQTDWLDSGHIILNRTDDFEVPVVLDWAIRNGGNCSAAKGNVMADFACRSANSECFDVDNGDGYRCNCSTGYDGNPYLDRGCTDIDECQHKENYGCHGVCSNTEGHYTCKCPPEETGDPTMKNGCRPKDKFTVALKAVTGVGVGVILLGSICCGTCLALQKSNLMRTKKKFFEHNGGIILQQQMRSYNGTTGGASGGFKIFSSEELKKATNNFAADQILGRGGHGIVYRGILTDNSVVAIKKSKMMEEAETKEFTREMLILSQINHRNVVKLLGCCLEVEVPMLVYEYVSNGTLYQYIHGGKGLNADTALDTRLRIGAESAEALAYMHSSASPPILHGDVKTANILLDGSLTAKVTDFGASKLAPSDEAEVIATLVQGTCGYLDPEYLMTCQLTDKSDVYSFGVVMLELLTRKKVLCFDGPEENRSLVACFVMAVKFGRHAELMDGNVRKEMGPEALEEVTHLLMRCVSMSGDERPRMKEVAERLEALRRYQQHPWGHAGGGDLEEEGEDEKSLLGRKQQCDVDYKFRPHDLLDLEGDSTYTYSL